MGNSVKFWRKRSRNANEEPLDTSLSGDLRADTMRPSCSQPGAAHIADTPSLELLKTTSHADVGEPKDISDKDEAKTLETAEQSQLLCVESDVSVAERTKEQPSLIHRLTKESVAEPEDSGTTGKTGHSSKTKKKRKTAKYKQKHGE